MEVSDDRVVVTGGGVGEEEGIFCSTRFELRKLIGETKADAPWGMVVQYNVNLITTAPTSAIFICGVIFFVDQESFTTLTPYLAFNYTVYL